MTKTEAALDAFLRSLSWKLNRVIRDRDAVPEGPESERTLRLYGNVVCDVRISIANRQAVSLGGVAAKVSALNGAFQDAGTDAFTESSSRVASTIQPSEKLVWSIIGDLALLEQAGALQSDLSCAHHAAFWPEYSEWQRYALEINDWYANARYNDATDDVANAFLNPREEKMRGHARALYERPVRNLNDVLALGIVALYWHGDDNPPLGGGVESIDERCTPTAAAAFLIRAVGILAKESGLFPFLQRSNFDLKWGAMHRKWDAEDRVEEVAND